MMRKEIPTWVAVVVILVVLVIIANTDPDDPLNTNPTARMISASSYLGGTGTNDSVRGGVIQPDGTIVLAANISDATFGVTPILLNGATSSSSGAIIRLSPDGRHILSVTRLANQVLDLAKDATGNLYVAARDKGLIKLNALATQIIWSRSYEGRGAYRVDAGPLGYSAILTFSVGTDPDASNPGSGIIYDNAARFRNNEVAF